MIRSHRRLVWLAWMTALALTTPAPGPVEALPGPATPVPAGDASPKADPGKPIARIWRGRTLAAKADAYEAYLFSSGISKILQTRGNLGVTVLRRQDGQETEFLVISIWESLDAVKRFAGKDYEKTVVLDRDRDYLLEVEPTVRHYDIEKEERSR
jgi:heme-degrading monooxygenase HmoA